MVRTLITLILAATFSAASAQSIEATEAMKVKATEKMQMVDRTVGGLNADQKVQVEQVYLEVEKYMAALELRYANAAKETRDGDMPGQIEQMDRYSKEKLATILTKDQYTTWTEASR